MYITVRMIMQMIAMTIVHQHQIKKKALLLLMRLRVMK